MTDCKYGQTKDKPNRSLNLLNGYEMALGKFDLFCLKLHSSLRRYVSYFKSPSQSSVTSISRMRSIVHWNNKFALKHNSLFYELICEKKMTINHRKNCFHSVRELGNNGSLFFLHKIMFYCLVTSVEVNGEIYVGTILVSIYFFK